MVFVGARGGEGQRRCSPSSSRRPEQVITAPVVPLLLLPLPLLRLHGGVARRRCRYCLAEQPVTVPATLVLSVDLHRRNHQVEGLITAAPPRVELPGAAALRSGSYQRNLGDLRVSLRCGRQSAASADAVNQGRVLGCAAISGGLIRGVPLEAMVHCCCCRDCMEEWLVAATITARRSNP